MSPPFFFVYLPASDSISFWRRANALQAIFAVCLRPSVSRLPRWRKCLMRVSASSVDLDRSQWRGVPGLCCSFPTNDTCATAATASGK